MDDLFFIKVLGKLATFSLKIFFFLIAGQLRE